MALWRADPGCPSPMITRQFLLASCCAVLLGTPAKLLSRGLWVIAVQFCEDVGCHVAEKVDRETLSSQRHTRGTFLVGIPHSDHDFRVAGNGRNAFIAVINFSPNFFRVLEEVEDVTLCIRTTGYPYLWLTDLAGD